MINRVKSLKNKFKKIVALGLATSLALNISVTEIHAGGYIEDLYLQYNGEVYKYRDRLITVEIDEKILQTGDMPAVLVNNTTMVPVREVFENEAIGATVNWNGATNEVYISYLDQFIVLKIDSKTAYVNNVPVELDVPAMLIQDMSKKYPKTMLPLRFVSESLGFDVEWKKDTFTAEIGTEKAMVSISDIKTDDSETLNPPKADVDKDVDKDAITDNKVVSDVQLNELEGANAKRKLPTALLSQPVVFNAMGNVGVIAEKKYTEADIVLENHELVYIDDIDYVKKNENMSFEINATGKITDVSSYTWEDKFIIEIVNADIELDKLIYEYGDSGVVTSVRIGSHINDDGDQYAKIVFDLNSLGNKFNLKLNENRDKLYVEAVENSIYKVELKQNELGDYIDITGVNATNVKTFRLSNPSRIVFDMPNTKTLVGSQSNIAEGQYVTSIRTSQFENTTARIVVEIDGQPDYKVIEVNDTTTRIQLTEPTYDNITYNNMNETPTIIIEKENTDNSLSIDNITYQDNYLEREYVITLPGDYIDYFGSGKVEINDAIIEDITFKLNGKGNTEVVIKSKTIREFRIEDTGNVLVIKAYKPSELYSKVVVLDAGHGGKDPGAVVGPIREKDINLSVILELKKILDKDPSIKVYYTRLDDAYPSLNDRTVLANEVDADIFISLHCNAYLTSFKGVETLFFPGPDTFEMNSFEVADIFQKVFTDNTAMYNYKVKSRDNLYVLKHTYMPAIILEMGFLTNEHDRSFLTDQEYHDDLANGVSASIYEMFKQFPTGR
jgi:N-acetylmuramoyl-L-alanine amidase